MKDRYPEAVDVFRALLKTESAGRRDALRDLKLDPELHEIVTGMLDADDEPSGWLPRASQDADRSEPGATANPDGTKWPRIQGFAIEAVAGRGGMGTVYRARQDGPERTVAIKVLDSAGGGARVNVHRLLQREISAISRLHHPNITTVYQLGVTIDRNDPCLVMEFIDGEPVTAFAETAKLTVRQRIELFLQVVDGVHHAHAMGVVHRDLKPGNVLACRSRNAAPPLAKVIDFGIAKVLSRGSDAEPAHDSITLKHVLGTIPYVAPEQLGIGVSSDGEADARSDVHALGVMLFELLTSELPYEITGVPLGVAVQRFSADTPRSLRSVRREGDTTAGGRTGWLDMEAILRKATARQPIDRYQTAAEFAGDLRRWLDGNAVHARRDRAFDQLLRFVRKNPALSATAAALVAALIGGAVVSASFAARAASAETQASARAGELAIENERLMRMDQFFAEILKSASVEQSEITARQPEELRAIDLIDWISKNIGERFADRPASATRYRLAIAESYTSLGRVGKAMAEYQLAESVAGPAPDDRIRLEMLLTRARIDLRRIWLADEGVETADVIETVRSAADLAESLEAWPEHISARNDLTSLLFGLNGPKQTLEHGQETVSLAEELIGDHANTSIAINNLAFLYQHTGDPDKAVEMYDRSIAMKERLGRGDRPDTLVSRANRIGAIRDRGTGEDLLPLFYELLEHRQSALPDHHPQVIDNRRIIGLLLLGHERFDEAVAELESTAEVSRPNAERLGWIAPGVERELIKAYRRVGRVDEAQAIYEAELAKPHSLEIQLEFKQDYAWWLSHTDRLDESESLLRELLDLTPEHDFHNTARRLMLLGRCLEKQGRTDEAIETWTRVVEGEGMPPYLVEQCRGHIEEAARE